MINIEILNYGERQKIIQGLNLVYKTLDETDKKCRGTIVNLKTRNISIGRMLGIEMKKKARNLPQITKLERQIKGNERQISEIEKFRKNYIVASTYKLYPLQQILTGTLKEAEKLEKAA